MNNIVYLNVGGTQYTTTKSTLCRYPDSMLGRMFSDENKFSLAKDKEGNIFIDGNGIIFEYILDYLRYDIIPDDKDHLKKFMVVCDYFQIPYNTEVTEDFTINRDKAKELNANPSLNEEENKIYQDILICIRDNANNLKSSYDVPTEITESIDFSGIAKIITKLKYLKFTVFFNHSNSSININWH